MSICHKIRVSPFYSPTQFSGVASRKSSSKCGSDGVISRISNSSLAKKGKAAASDVSYVTKRLLKSTGKAAWIVTTTFIVLGLPLIIEMEREAQFNELELQQNSLLGAPPAQPAFPGPPK